MVIEILKLLLGFAGEHPFLVFLTAPFWFVLGLAPFIAITEIFETLIDALKNDTKEKKK